MSRKAESTVNRVVRHLSAAGGSGILGDVSRRLGLCGALARALKTDPALIQFVSQETCRNKTSHREQTRLTLTALGIAYAQTLKSGGKPARLSFVNWQAQLAQMTQERVPAALQITRDAEDGARWRLQESERKARDRAAEAKRAAREKPEPKQPSAGRVRSEEDLEARREWAASKGFTSKDQSESDDDEPEPIVAPKAGKFGAPPPLPAGELYQQQTGKIPSRYFEPSEDLAPAIPPTAQIPGTQVPDYLKAQAEVFAEIRRDQIRSNEPVFDEPGFQNRPTARDVFNQQQANANRDRILKLFHETPYAGELLPNGKIRFDNRDLSLEQWEDVRFRTAS